MAKRFDVSKGPNGCVASEGVWIGITVLDAPAFGSEEEVFSAIVTVSVDASGWIAVGGAAVPMRSCGGGNRLKKCSSRGCSFCAKAMCFLIVAVAMVGVCALRSGGVALEVRTAEGVRG